MIKIRNSNTPHTPGTPNTPRTPITQRAPKRTTKIPYPDSDATLTDNLLNIPTTKRQNAADFF